jgi:hypothetical protein
VQVGFELEEVQVTPRSLDSIMSMTSGLAAHRAKELASYLKIDMQVQLFSSTSKSIALMYHGSSRPRAILKSSSGENDTGFILKSRS